VQYPGEISDAAQPQLWLLPIPKPRAKERLSVRSAVAVITAVSLTLWGLTALTVICVIAE
jgi:hypothetical protein